MVHIIRRLVVALDQTELGSEDRKKTQSLLELLSGQQEIPSDSSRWMDWLEEQAEGEPTWDQAEERIGSLHSVRVSVEVPDDPIPPEDGARMPLTKEQQVWDKALKRSERMRNRKGRPIQNLLVLLVLVAIGYLGHKTWPKVKVWFENLRTSKVEAEVQPEVLWGNYQPRLQEIPEKDLLIHLTSIPDMVMPSPMQRQDLLEPSLALKTWGRLTLQEKLFSQIGKIEQIPPLPTDFFRASSRNWKIIRLSGLSAPEEMFFKEDVEMRKGRALISIQRSLSGRGSAHKIMLNEKGIMAWTWRLIMKKGQRLEGTVFRKKNPDRLEWSGKVSGGKQWAGKREISSQEVVFPAIWSPSLFSLRDRPVFHPIGGRVSEGETFWGDVELVMEEGDVLGLSSSLGGWSEKWTPVVSTEERP